VGPIVDIERDSEEKLGISSRVEQVMNTLWDSYE